MTDRMPYSHMPIMMLGFMSAECLRLTAILIATSMT
jgi:hypothetical protein